MSAEPKSRPDDLAASKAEIERLRRVLSWPSAQPANDQGGGGPGGPPPDVLLTTLIHNERTKLSATLLNGVALAFIVGGGVTVLTGLGSLPNPEDQLLRALVWIITGGGIHMLARHILGGLQ